MTTAWPNVTLGDIVTAQYGLSVSASDDGTVPILGMKNLQEGRIVFGELARVVLTKKEIEDYQVHAGDILFNRTNSFDLVGKSSLVEETTIEPTVFASYLVRLKVDEAKALPAYVNYVLNSPSSEKRLKDIATPGVSQFNINPTSLRKHFRISLPTLPEQKAIAAVLSTWDRGIRQLTDLIAAKLRFKQGLMQQLLTGKRRFPEFNSTSFVESHVGDVLKETFRPVAWNEQELYRLASIRRHSGGLFWREALTGKQIKVKKLHTLHGGDFLISHIQAAYGAMGIVPAEFSGGKVSDMYTILTPKVAGTIDMRYIDYLSQMKRMRHQAYLACNGFFAERLRLNFDPAEFMKQKLVLPESVEEQGKIADLLDSLVMEIKLLQKQLEALKQQKKGLMQKLLTGEVRVNVPKGVT